MQDELEFINLRHLKLLQKKKIRFIITEKNMLMLMFWLKSVKILNSELFQKII